MSSTRYDTEGGAFSRSAGGAAFRGTVLIAVAVLVGLLLLATGLDDDTGELATSGTSSGTTTPTTGGSGGNGTSASSTTTAPIKPPAQVKVLVANGSGVSGAAQTMSETLKAQGYNVLEPGNANQQVEATTVYYTRGFQREAQRLAGEIKASAATVQALPVPGPVADAAAAGVVVVLGPDLAKAG